MTASLERRSTGATGHIDGRLVPRALGSIRVVGLARTAEKLADIWWRDRVGVREGDLASRGRVAFIQARGQDQRVDATALFRPSGLLGRRHRRAMFPFHVLILGLMARQIAPRVEAEPS